MCIHKDRHTHIETIRPKRATPVEGIDTHTHRGIDTHTHTHIETIRPKRETAVAALLPSYAHMHIHIIHTYTYRHRHTHTHRDLRERRQ
jgi:hypothetical protein